MYPSLALGLCLVCCLGLLESSHEQKKFRNSHALLDPPANVFIANATFDTQLFSCVDTSDSSRMLIMRPTDLDFSIAL